jgi:hypothetical protein
VLALAADGFMPAPGEAGVEIRKATKRDVIDMSSRVEDCVIRAELGNLAPILEAISAKGTR